MERHLKFVECTEVQKQLLATFQFLGNALQWWESTTTSEERDRLTYADFQIKFNNKYFPYAIRSVKKREFLELDQGSKSVVEFEQEFINLSMFVPEEVDTENKKMECFIKGLSWPIKQMVLVNPANTAYSQVVDVAMLHWQERINHQKKLGKR